MKLTLTCASRISVSLIVLALKSALLLVPIAGHGQSYHFRKYQVEDGLLHNTVQCFLQDSRGFLWVGTQNGLNRFDGYSFIDFKRFGEEIYLGGNSVHALCEDQWGRLWVGTNQGAYVYNEERQEFERFNVETRYHVTVSTEVKAIAQASDGQLWIGTAGQGLFRYRLEDSVLFQESRYAAFIEHLAEDLAYGRMFVAAIHEGLMSFSLDGGFLDLHAPMESLRLSEDAAISFVDYVNGSVWFGIGNHTVGRIDSMAICLTTNRENPMGKVRCAAALDSSSVFLGTDRGLYRFDPSSETFARLDNPLLESQALSDETINQILVDRERGVWIATNLGGLNYLGPHATKIDYFLPKTERGNPAKMVSEFCEDENGRIYVGTQHGLYRFDAASRTLRAITVGGHDNLDIRALLLDGNDLWIGTKGAGLKVLNLETHGVKEYVHAKGDPHTINSNDVMDLFKDRTGTIYVGTSWGVCRFNRQEQVFKTLNFAGAMIAVNHMVQDAGGDLWVATNNAGIFRISTEDNLKYQHYFRQHNDVREINSNSVSALYPGDDGRMWVGTNGAGLCYFDGEQGHFVSIDSAEEILPNQVVYAIEGDSHGFLWLSTDGGLLRMDVNGSTDHRRFTKEDGLQSNQFNFNASLRARDGMLFFGGINGFNRLHPEAVSVNRIAPPVYITTVKASEEGKEAVVQVTDAAYLTGGLKLPHFQNDLAIAFAALSYQQPEKNRYRYMLEGLDNTWRPLEGSNQVIYNNLPPGDYVFKALGSNNDATWNKTPAMLRVTIAPPWWRSNWAYSLYVLAAFGGAVVLIRALLKREKRRYQQKMATYKEKQERDVYRSKIRFFINLVHEIRTPLTLISVPLQRLLDGPSNADQKRFLSVMDKNVNYLLGVVNELLDFQKIENAHPHLVPKYQDIKAILTGMADHFEGFSAIRNFRLEMSFPDSDVWAWVDKEALQKILYNLIGNAVKHTREVIWINVSEDDAQIAISVNDDGMGVPPEDRDRIFEPFQQLGGETGGSGIGLFYSRVLADAMRATITVRDNDRGGATFELKFPAFNNVMKSPPPILQSEAEEEEEPTAYDKGDNEPVTEPTARVLVVEDNAELLQLFVDSLQDRFVVTAARDGSEALQILENEPIDVVVSDVMMPRTGGLELTRRIKSSLELCHIPVVLLTAKTTTEAKEEGLSVGADVYLDKPVSLRQLKHQLRNLMRLKQVMQQRIQASPYYAAVGQALPKRDQEFLEKLHDEIDSRMADMDFSIDSLADTMFMSRSNFYRKIKSLTGMAPNHYLRAVRLKKAAYLLTRDSRINEVYEQVGFSSSSYFAKCFKAQYKQTPREYMLNCRSHDVQ